MENVCLSFKVFENIRKSSEIVEQSSENHRKFSGILQRIWKNVENVRKG